MRRFGKFPLKLLSWLPWLWLALFAVFTAAVTAQQGQWPRYGQPDPKQTGALAPLHDVLLASLVPTLAGPLLLGAIALAFTLTRRVPPFSFGLIATHLSGWAAMLVLLAGDVAGLGEWFMD